MASELSSVKRLGWSEYLGKTNTLVKMVFLGRRYVRVQSFWVPAVEAAEQVLIATGYENPTDYIGSYRKRFIAGTTIWSWHSYGGPLDLDYGGDNPDSPDQPGVDKNPHLKKRIYPGDAGFGVEFQILEHQVNAMEAIRTNNGKKVWRWLGWSIGDTMHFEPACSPADIATGIDPTSLAEEPFMTRFADVPEDHLFYADIEWLAETGITRGTGVNEDEELLYSPNGLVTREHMAAFLHRFNNYLESLPND